MLEAGQISLVTQLGLVLNGVVNLDVATALYLHHMSRRPIVYFLS